MSDLQKIIDFFEEEISWYKSCIEGKEGEILQTAAKECDYDGRIKVYQAVIAALKEKQHNDELRKRLYNIFGGDVTLDLMVDELQHHLEEPDNPHPLYAKILTYEDADKWKRWKLAEQQGRLAELPCAVGEDVYQIIKTGFSETYTIMHEGHEYSREVPYWGIWPCKFNLKLMDEFGKTVFLTHEAAQAALEKMLK